jgi:putative DNA primase/helicase
MSNAASIGKALCGRPAGDGWLVRCPVRTHGQGRRDRTPSLHVTDGDVRGRLLVHCYAGCDPRDVLAELRRRELIGEERSAPWRRSERPPSPPAEAPAHEPDAKALALWRSGLSAPGTAVEKYLQARGITVPTPPSIRFATVLHLDRVEMPVMLAAVQRPDDSKVVAVQRTMLTWSGKKAAVSTPRITTGALGLGAVRLAAATDVLGLAEGVEDALAAMQLTGVPCWACLGAARMHRVLVPARVRELHIFADDDEPGRAAAERTAEFHCNRGLKVLVRLPPACAKDYAEIVGAAANRNGAAA